MNCLQESLIQSVLKRHKSPKQIKTPPKIKVKIKRKVTEHNDFAMPSSTKRSRHSSKSSLTASLCDPQDDTELDLSLNSSQFQQNSTDLSPSGLRTIIHRWNVKTEDETQKSLCDFFGVIPVLKENHPTLFAITNHIKGDDFFLPKLNLEIWSKWPGSKPNSVEVKNLKEKYPTFSRNWSPTDEERLIKRFRKIMKRSGLNVKNGDGGNLVEEIRSLPEDSSAIAKCLVGGYIGKPFLEEKLAIMVWKRLCHHISQIEPKTNGDVTIGTETEIEATFVEDMEDQNPKTLVWFGLNEPKNDLTNEMIISPDIEDHNENALDLENENMSDQHRIPENDLRKVAISATIENHNGNCSNSKSEILPDQQRIPENDPRNDDISAATENPRGNGLDSENESMSNQQRIPKNVSGNSKKCRRRTLYTPESEPLDISGQVQAIPLNENANIEVPYETQKKKKVAEPKRSKTQQNKIKREIKEDEDQGILYHQLRHFLNSAQSFQKKVYIAYMAVPTGGQKCFVSEI